METRRVEINIEDLSIDEGKAGWLAGRGITPAQVFQVLWNTAFEPHFFVRVNADKGNKMEYAMVGRTVEGRYMSIPIEQVEGTHWRVISGNKLNDKRGERRYQKE